MMAGRSWRRLIFDIVLAFAASIAIVMPFAREWFIPDRMESEGIAVASVFSEALCGKLFAALIVSTIALWSTLQQREGTLPKRIAALPIFRTAFVIGSTIAVGMGAFDLCSAYHAAGNEMHGFCCCWLTGALAGLGSFLAALVCVTGRTLLELTRSVLRIIITLFVLLRRVAVVHRSEMLGDNVSRVLNGPRLARHIAGRAPPLVA